MVKTKEKMDQYYTPYSAKCDLYFGDNIQCALCKVSTVDSDVEEQAKEQVTIMAEKVTDMTSPSILIAFFLVVVPFVVSTAQWRHHVYPLSKLWGSHR